MPPAPLPPPKQYPAMSAFAGDTNDPHRARVQSHQGYDATDPYHRHHHYPNYSAQFDRYPKAAANTSDTNPSTLQQFQPSSAVYPMPSDEELAPSLPPQNSYWHREADHVSASVAEFNSPQPDHWGSIDGFTSRPMSSATGIIALYGGDDDFRRGSDASSLDNESSGPASAARVPCRVRRPLPTIPDQHSSSTSASPRLPDLEEHSSQRPVSPFAPTAASVVPSPLHLPYLEFVSRTRQQPQPHPLLQPSKNEEGCFSMSRVQIPSSPSRSNQSIYPAWSPLSSSFSSAQNSPATGISYSSLHRSQNSLGAMSAMSADSWVSEDDCKTRHGVATGFDGSLRRSDDHRTVKDHDDPDDSIAYRANNLSRLRIETGATKRRAPLPSVPTFQQPSPGSHSVLRRESEDDLVMRPIQVTPAEESFSAAVNSFQEEPDSYHFDGSTRARNETLDQSSNSQALTPVNSHTSSLQSSAGSHPERRDTLQPGPSQEARISRTSFVDFSLLSHLALLLKDALPRGIHVKGSIGYPDSFTGKDLVTTIQSLIPLDRTSAAAGGDVGRSWESHAQEKLRRLALSIARSLKAQLFYNEVDWSDGDLQDNLEQVYVFFDPLLAEPSSGPGSGQAARHDDKFSFGDDTLTLSANFCKRASIAKKREHPISLDDREELPSGVFVPLTACYSPSCPSGRGCYSPSCPQSAKSLLQNFGAAAFAGLSSDSQALAGAAGGMAYKAWAELVPPELLASLRKDEITRQNAILEHIQKEEDFLADLELLENVFIAGLEKPSASGDPPSIPIGPERDDFIREVFGNHRELVAHVRNFVERLHIRQREESPIIQSIGDLFLDAALAWQDAFVTYVSAYPIAKSRIGREQTVNPRFRDFLEKCRREPACRRLGLDNFIHRALPHLQRHPLLLQTIIDKTDESNSDRENCIQAKELIVQQCKMADRSIQAAQVRAKIRNFAYNLQTKRNKAVVDMDLLNPERELIHEGRVYRRPDFTELDWTELQAVLFDNYFVITKLKTRPEGVDEDASTFVLAKRPIPVEMLEVSGVNEPSVSFSLGLNALHLRSDRESRSLWPLTIHHAGGKLEPLTLYITSKHRRVEWRTKIEEAKGLRKSVVDANRAFDIQGICDAPFAQPSAMTGLDPERAPPGADSSMFHGRISCAAPFSMADQRKLMALGCADGVWIGLRNDPSSFRKVLHLKHVTQCAVLEDFGIFVVLADKVLISYSLEALVPTSTGGAAPLRPPQKLSGNRGVLFFGVGVLKDRTLLVYMKKKANESVFKALEPVINQAAAPNSKSAGSLFNKLRNDMGGKGADWFRMFKVFFIPSEAYSIQFLRSKLAIVCTRGFEIMNLDTLLPGTIPDFSRSPRNDVRILALARRVETAKPLGMFKLPGTDSDFLLCYDGFACYVDRSGEPIRLEAVLEWEGTPQSVAFSAPFVLAFDPHFVEVRDALSGRLVQIIRGTDVRYVSGSGILEGSSSTSPSIICVHRVKPRGTGKTAGGSDGATAAAAIATTIAPSTPSSQTTAYDEQEVFELVPTHPQLLARRDTTATTSSGLLSYSRTRSSTRSRHTTGDGSGWSSGVEGGGGSGGNGDESLTMPSLSQHQEYLQQQGFAIRTILPDPTAPAGWI